MTHVAIVPQSILRKWDRIALLQLAKAANRMHGELDEIRLERDQIVRRYTIAQINADDAWNQLMDMQLQLCEQHGMEPGLTQSGHLVMVKPT